MAVSTGSLAAYPLRQVFRVARECGADGLELLLHYESLLRGPAYVERLSWEYNLPVLSVHPPVGRLFKLLRRRAIDMCVDWACALRAPRLTIHPPLLYPGSAVKSRFSDPQYFMQRALAWQQRLSVCGSRLCLENRDWGYEKPEADPLAHLRALRDHACSDSLGVTLDTTHAGTSGLPLAEVYSAVSGCIENVHLSDFDGRTHLLPGAGDLPLREFMGWLARDGYRGQVTLEIYPLYLRPWHPNELRRTLRRAVCFARGDVVCA